MSLLHSVVLRFDVFPDKYPHFSARTIKFLPELKPLVQSGKRATPWVLRVRGSGRDPEQRAFPACGSKLEHPVSQDGHSVSLASSRYRSAPKVPSQKGLLFHKGQVGSLWTAADKGRRNLAKVVTVKSRGSLEAPDRPEHATLSRGYS